MTKLGHSTYCRHGTEGFLREKQGRHRRVPITEENDASHLKSEYRSLSCHNEYSDRVTQQDASRLIRGAVARRDRSRKGVPLGEAHGRGSCTRRRGEEELHSVRGALSSSVTFSTSNASASASFTHKASACPRSFRAPLLVIWWLQHLCRKTTAALASVLKISLCFAREMDFLSAVADGTLPALVSGHLPARRQLACSQRVSVHRSGRELFRVPHQ